MLFTLPLVESATQGQCEKCISNEKREAASPELGYSGLGTNWSPNPFQWFVHAESFERRECLSFDVAATTVDSRSRNAAIRDAFDVIGLLELVGLFAGPHVDAQHALFTARQNHFSIERRARRVTSKFGVECQKPRVHQRVIH